MAIHGNAAAPPAPLEGTVEGVETGLISVPLEPTKIQDLFAVEGALNSLIDAIEAKVTEFSADVTTKEGQAEIRSLAFKVVKSKTYLASLKKSLTVELKALPTRIDRNWSAYETRLEALQVAARKPLTDWEAEEERKEAARQQAIKDAAAAAQMGVDHEFALLLNEKFDRDREDRQKAEAQAKLDEEARLKAEAEARTAKEAADRAAAEQAAADKATAEAAAAVKRAEEETARALQAQKDAEALAQKTKEEADARAEQARKDTIAAAEVAAARATQAEKDRVEALRVAEATAQTARDRDVEHQRRINGEVLTDLLALGFEEERAKALIKAILQNKIRHLSLKY